MWDFNMATKGRKITVKYYWLLVVVAIHLTPCVSISDEEENIDNIPSGRKDTTYVKDLDTCIKDADCNSEEESFKSSEKITESDFDRETFTTEKVNVVLTNDQSDEPLLKTWKEEQSSIVDQDESEKDNTHSFKEQENIQTEDKKEYKEDTVDVNHPQTDDDVESTDQFSDSKVIDGVNLKSNSSNSSVIYEWFKYFVDSFLEEFKEGVISKQSEKENKTNSSDIDQPVNESKALNVSDEIDNPGIVTVNFTGIQNTTENGKKMKFECLGRNVTDNVNATVKIITSAKLLQLISVIDKNETENATDCLVVLFYAPWCKFCARTAPHFNALARAFPQLDFVAVDTAQFSNLLARFGTVSVPNVIVFHQSRSTVKFNQTERVFANYVSFLQNATGLEPNSSVEVTDEDYIGPVPSVPTDDPDYLLLLSWVFVIFCSSCMFIKSTKGQQWITRVRVLWQEHQHID